MYGAPDAYHQSADAQRENIVRVAIARVGRGDPGGAGCVRLHGQIGCLRYDEYDAVLSKSLEKRGLTSLICIVVR